MNKSILIIEDERDIQQAMKEVLEEHGYDVFLANNGKEGVEMLRSVGSTPILIILDLMMPGTNGWQFLDIQRADPNFREIPTIICSAFRESAKGIKANGFLKKPVELDDLLGVVKTFS